MSEPASVEWAVARSALEWGASGDLHAVVVHERGALVAAIDGLGHGPEAELAARSAATVIAANARESPDAVLVRCHAALRATRGAVMTLAAFDVPSACMTWLGVGNVQALLLRDDPCAAPVREAILPRAGVVGYQIPALHPVTLPIRRGDLVIFTSDGITDGFIDGLIIEDDLQRMADRVLAAHASGRDDALVLLVRYLGAAT